MSTQACAAIQVIDSITGFPSEWLTADGAIFLDLTTDFDFGLSKNVEELTDINELQLSGVYGFAIPKTPVNQFILRDWIDPNTFDFKATPVNVIAYSGGTVITQRYLYVRESRWRDNSIECALVNDESHWAIGASRLKLNQIPYDDFTFTQLNVLNNMQNDHNYADGDAGIYFQMANYGNLYQDRRINVEYLRPWYHVLGVLHKGFKYLGWRFESPLLETTIGRQWISYLLDPEYYTVGTENKIFLATLTAFEVDYYGDQKDTPQTIDYDQVLDDPTAAYVGGRYRGNGAFLVEASIRYSSNWTIYHTTAIRILVYKDSNTAPTIIKTTTGGVKAFNSEERELVVKSDEEITLLPGQWIEIEYVGFGASYVDQILGGTLRIQPTKIFPSEGETFNPGLLLRKDNFIDFCKGVLHVMRGKVETLYDCKTVRFFPNYPVEYYGEDVEGFYNNGEMITVDPMQVHRSEISRPPDFTRSRYILLAYKAGSDILVKRKEDALQYPLHSRIIDLGDEFTDDKPEELRNPYFEATANDWVSNWSKIDNGIPLDLPHLLDHEPEEDKVKISTNIGPRILITKGWTGVIYKAQDGTEEAADYDFGNFLVVITSYDSYPWGFQLPVGFDETGEVPEENLVYGEKDNDLYNLFWKRWAFETIKNFTVDMLVFMHTRDYHNWDLRTVYAFLVGSKRSLGYLLSINQFQACRGTATQVIFNANATTVGQFPTEPEEEDPCDSYQYDLDYVEASGVYTFSVTTDSPGNITIQYRFHDQTTWTTASVVSNPDRLFYVRVLDDECGNTPKITIPIDPCGDNAPVLIITYRYDEDSSEHCVTAELGGIIEDPVDTITLTVSLDGDTPVSYTIGTEVCGATEDFCFDGEVQFDNDCDPIPLEQCFEVPPVVLDCQNNVPDVGYQLVGLDAYQLLLNGSWVSPPATWHFQFKDVGADESTAKIWDTKSPIVKETFQARVVMFFCDECPKVCSTWQTIPTPMALKTQKTTFAWDFSPMTEEHWTRVEDLLKDKNYKDLMLLHNDLRLSTAYYCCGRDSVAVKNWFEYGLRLHRGSPQKG